MHPGRRYPEERTYAAVRVPVRREQEEQSMFQCIASSPASCCDRNDFYRALFAFFDANCFTSCFDITQNLGVLPRAVADFFPCKDAIVSRGNALDLEFA